MIDGYCERLGPGLWAEPANALTNLAFLLAAGLLAGRIRGRAPVSVWLMPVLIGVVGLCSLSFHTFATRLTGALDSLSIVVFVLTAVVAYLHWMWGVAWRLAWLGAPAFLAVVAAELLLSLAAGPDATVGGYGPVLLGLLGMALAVRFTALGQARRYGDWLLAATGVFAVSLALRTVDGAVCPTMPIGTHFLWHCLNAVVLFLVGFPIVSRWRGGHHA
jgi:hypothetical protein